MKSRSYTKIVETVLILGVGFFLYKCTKSRLYEDDEKKQYEKVKQYLLTETTLANNRLPIMWIHVPYGMNSRNWESFGSRNTKELNQPYLYLTIRSLIQCCGNRYQLCMLDDSTFSKIIPNWSIDINSLDESSKNNVRTLAMANILHMYGGVLIPPSFICINNLHELQNQSKMFVGEFISRSTSNYSYEFNTRLMGCKKNDVTMKEFILFLEDLTSKDYTEESIMLNKIGAWCKEKHCNKELLKISAQQLGCKDADNKPILLDRLMSSTFIELSNDAFGVYVPADELLNRHAFGWFIRLSPLQVLEADTMISKFILASNG